MEFDSGSWHSAKIICRPAGKDDDTPFDGSGLKIKSIKTRRQLNEAEFESILRVTEKYLLSKPSHKLAPFTFGWLLELHREMLGSIWSWARLVANIWLMQHDQPVTIWPATDLRNTESPIRGEYIAAMKQADLRNYGPLIDLHKKFSE